MMEPGSLPLPEEAVLDWAALIQQQVQSVLQAALPHVIQQVVDQASARHCPVSPRSSSLRVDRDSRAMERYNMLEDGVKESKVAAPEKFSGKKGNEVYRWFAQPRLVFHAKPRTYHSDGDKIAYAFSYMRGSPQLKLGHANFAGAR